MPEQLERREFYFQGDDKVYGPFTPSDLIALATSGKILAHTLVQKAGGEWVEARQSRSLRVAISQSTGVGKEPQPDTEPNAAPVPPEHVSVPTKPPVGNARGLLGRPVVFSVLGVILVAITVYFVWQAMIPTSRHQEVDGRIATTGRSTADADTTLQERVLLDPATLYERSHPAVVTINTKDDQGYDAGLGSGFFVDPEWVKDRYSGFSRHQRMAEHSGGGEEPDVQFCYLLTNYHVIESAVDAFITFSDGQSGRVHEVVAESPDQDIAVLCIILNSREPVSTLPLAEDRPLQIGETVYALGSPKGLESTISEGIVSGKREIVDGVTWLQTSAPISPGSSGGPLLNEFGEVVGITTASHRTGQNLNFAIPVDCVVAILRKPYNSRDLWRGSGVGPEEAEAYYSVLVRMGQPHDVLSRFLRIEKLLLDDDNTEAMRVLRQMSPSDLGEAEYIWHYSFGRAAFGVYSAKYQGANPGTVQGVYDQARQSKDHRIAILAFRRATKLRPDFSPAYSRLSRCLVNEGRFEEGLAVTNDLVRLVPRCSAAYRQRGRILHALKRNRAAYDDLLIAADLGPQNPNVFAALASVSGSLRMHQEEIGHYETAIALGVRNPEVYNFNIGVTYQGMGMYEQALAYYAKARAFRAIGPDIDKAVAECQAALR